MQVFYDGGQSWDESEVRDALSSCSALQYRKRYALMRVDPACVQHPSIHVTARGSSQLRGILHEELHRGMRRQNNVDGCAPCVDGAISDGALALRHRPRRIMCARVKLMQAFCNGGQSRDESEVRDASSSLSACLRYCTARKNRNLIQMSLRCL